MRIKQDCMSAGGSLCLQRAVLRGQLLCCGARCLRLADKTAYCSRLGCEGTINHVKHSCAPWGPCRYVCGTLTAASELTHESMGHHDPEGGGLPGDSGAFVVCGGGKRPALRSRGVHAFSAETGGEYIDHLTAVNNVLALMRRSFLPT